MTAREECGSRRDPGGGSRTQRRDAIMPPRLHHRAGTQVVGGGAVRPQHHPASAAAVVAAAETSSHSLPARHRPSRSRRPRKGEADGIADAVDAAVAVVRGAGRQRRRPPAGEGGVRQRPPASARRSRIATRHRKSPSWPAVPVAALTTSTRHLQTGRIQPTRQGRRLPSVGLVRRSGLLTVPARGGGLPAPPGSQSRLPATSRTAAMRTVKVAASLRRWVMVPVPPPATPRQVNRRLIRRREARPPVDRYGCVAGSQSEDGGGGPGRVRKLVRNKWRRLGPWLRRAARRPPLTSTRPCCRDWNQRHP